jgi:hypothetical protein
LPDDSKVRIGLRRRMTAQCNSGKEQRQPRTDHSGYLLGAEIKLQRISYA